MIKIGIIGAMELEVEALKKAAGCDKTVKKAGMEFCEGNIYGKNVVIVKCGVGKVNAALCVQILADVYNVTHIINTGVAGSLNNELNIGDIVLSEIAVQHDMDAVGLGCVPGQIPYMDEYEFKADPSLINLAREVASQILPSINVKIGKILSGDVFVSQSDVKERLINRFGGDCCEMEGASVAQGCFLNCIPFLIIRAVSDKADDSAELDFPTFEKNSAANSSLLVEKLISRI